MRVIDRQDVCTKSKNIVIYDCLYRTACRLLFTYFIITII